MQTAKVAPASPAEPEADEGGARDAAVKAREVLLRKLNGLGWIQERHLWCRVMHNEKAHDAIATTIRATDKRTKEKEQKTLEARKLKHFNNMVHVKIVRHAANGEVQHYVIATQASIYLNKLSELIGERLRIPKKRLQILWLHQSGDTVLLDSQRTFDTFHDAEWCAAPWLLHVHESAPAPLTKSTSRGSLVKKRSSSYEAQAGDAPATHTRISLDRMAQSLFDRYDLNNNGKIERSELRRMLMMVDREALGVSAKLMEQYITQEFRDVDADASGAIDLVEFTAYVTRMAQWLRDELMATASHKNVFATLASRAIQITTPPTAPDSSGVIDAGKYGLKLHVPDGAFGAGGGAQVALSTLAPMRVAYLSENEQRKRGEFVFSLVVRLDVHYADGRAETAASAPEEGKHTPFATPLTLTMPHCFSTNAEEATESLVMLGAPHGATQWRSIDGLSTADMSEPVRFDGGLLHVQLPYPGVFCAFSSPDVEDIAMVRWYVFAAPECARDAPTTVRVLLVPELPDQIDEMHISESSEWGLSKCVGRSHAPFAVIQGATFRLKYGSGQQRELKWHGGRVKTEFTFVPPVASSSSSDDEAVSETILIDVLEGEGKRAAVPAVVAKRAGMSATDHPLPFVLDLRPTVRPGPPRKLELVRTQWDFVLRWLPPPPPPRINGGGSSRKPPVITHYALELSVPSTSGTYGPFCEIWSGPAKVVPDWWHGEEAEKAAAADHDKEKSATTNAPAKAPAGADKYMAADEEVEGGAKRESSSTADGSVVGSAAADDSAAAPASRPFSYTLEVAPELFGRLRLRCWSECELLPSCYSEEVKLPRFLGKHTTKSSEREALERRRKEHEAAHGGRAKPSKREWGSPAPPATLPRAVTSTANAAKRLSLMLPYDVPAPPALPGVAEAGARLAAFFATAGVAHAGSGVHLGVSIDHVLDAVTRGRTRATLEQPLMALLEVVFSDVLLPMLDTVVTLQDEAVFVIEKVGGIIRQAGEASIKTGHVSYAVAEPYLTDLLAVVMEVYETLRQCETEALFANHLADADYPNKLRATLKDELTTRVCDILWRLSTALLKLQLAEIDADEAKRCSSHDAAARLAVVSRIIAAAKAPKQAPAFSFFRWLRRGYW